MAFVATFKKALDHVNELAASDAKIKDALKRYSGRSFIFNVKDDAVYLFKITPNKIEFNVNVLPDDILEDMYLEMDLNRAKKLVYERTVNSIDVILGRIRWKNMSMSDVTFLRNLLSNYDRH